MKKINILLFSCLFTLILFGCEEGTYDTTHGTTKEKESHSIWSYEGEGGPNYWAGLTTEYSTCGDGRNQSPIDMIDAKKTNLERILFSYTSSPLKIINNGHTIKIDYAPGNSINAGREIYELLQIHFHTPSEHSIEGKQYDMEIHLVHKSLKGELAVVGVLVEKGNENPEIEKIWNNLPKEKYKEEIKDIKVNALNLLPTDKSYFNYSGSLTTPPCTEGVNWYIMKEQLEISEKQIAVFAKIFNHNARPIQFRNDREVLVSN